VAPHERRDEDLVLDAQLSQLRQLELTLDRDAAAWRLSATRRATLAGIGGVPLDVTMSVSATMRALRQTSLNGLQDMGLVTEAPVSIPELLRRR